MNAEKLRGQGAGSLKYGTAAFCLLALTLIVAAPSMAAGPSWPDGLREAVNSHFQTLQVTEYLTRDSTLEDPRGVQPMTSFDRASHKCHEVPGQVYRVYRVPSYFKEDADGSYLLRVKFELFYRQAEDIGGIFAMPWEQGSDGAIQVRFKQVGGDWEAVETRELLE